MYLLDTDTVIYNFKGHDSLVKNLHAHIHDPIKISAVTLMELYYGAYKSRKVESNLANIKALENALEIIPTGRESAEIFGSYKSRLEKLGTPLDDFDLILASCALANNMVLVTNNTRHFERIEGLKLTNWTIYPES
ncbi:MAG: type II toxin-antitoxin system VapC family toxin [Desulfobacterales bacterium]